MRLKNADELIMHYLCRNRSKYSQFNAGNHERPTNVLLQAGILELVFIQVMNITDNFPAPSK